MALSKQERADLEHNVSRIKEDIRNKEAILAGYERDPSMKRYIPDIKHHISGSKRELQHCMDALRRG